MYLKHADRLGKALGICTCTALDHVWVSSLTVHNFPIYLPFFFELPFLLVGVRQMSLAMQFHMMWAKVPVTRYLFGAFIAHRKVAGFVFVARVHLFECFVTAFNEDDMIVISDYIVTPSIDRVTFAYSTYAIFAE
jgi:hypothetical protein